MCGIAGIYLKSKKAGDDRGMAEFANALLLEIEHRGRHATGFVSVGWDRSVKLDKGDRPASEFIKDRESFQKGVQCVLLHTRWATQGKAEVIGNNHPVIFNTCFATHNGHIHNDSELFKSEELKRNFEVDSEVIPAVLDKHGLDSPDNIRKALEKFEGSMAIAAIDPVRNPTRLVLAKGKNSPLYIFENQNVILWASEFSAIKDAWGKVIGTPPKADKIKHTPEGVFFVADDYGELGRYEFEAKGKKYVYTPGPRGTNHFRGRGNGFGRGNQPIRPWDSNGVFNTRREFDVALSDHRKTSERLARHYGNRESYDDETDFADVKGCKTWINCLCGRSIIEEDMVSHLKYGNICIDCAHVIAVKYKTVAEAAAEEEKEKREDPLKDVIIPELSDEDRRNLESWAFQEARIHRYTLNDLSDATGYSAFALDFLLYRTDATGADFGAKMLSVKYALKRAYTILEAAMHSDHAEDVAHSIDFEKAITVEDAQEIAAGMFYPWTAYSETPKGTNETHIKYVCEEHGEIFYFGEHCYNCLDDHDDVDYTKFMADDKWPGEDSCGVEAFEGDINALEKCEDCGAWNYIGAECIPCNAEESKPKAIEAPKVEKCCCKATRDRKCRRKIKLIVTNSMVGKALGYCPMHYSKCSKGKCNSDAHFTGLDGQRYCHKHSRGVQGIADTQATKGGNTLTIEEVN